MSKRKNDDTVARQLARKIKLENQFKPELKRFFKQVGKDAMSVWRSNQSIPSLNSFELELIALLRNHYRRVSKKFSKELRIESKNMGNILETKQTDQIDDAIDREIVDYINQHSMQQSIFILNTTVNELNAIAATTIAAAALSETFVSNDQLAREIQVEFDQRSSGRIDTIAMTETQTPAEQFKLIEAAAVAALVPVVKTWNTILDERTRPAHVAADRQEKKIGVPFIVDGERLPVPGSTALGASLKNIINCRCASINSIAGSSPSIVSGVRIS